jgi:hypothetical protein
MHCTGGFPGAYNDKTIARYDSFITDVGKNTKFTDFKYSIRTKQGVAETKGPQKLFVVFPNLLTTFSRSLPYL